MSDEVGSVDMRPPLGLILDGYERQNYRPETAIAEFVDNSVASYLLHREELEQKYGNDFRLRIVVSYSSYNQTLTITDNAFGMTYQRLQDALKISNPPSYIGGRNEYGMGLKTAASWFSKEWSVTTIAPDGDGQYRANVDIKQLISTGDNEIKIHRDNGPDKLNIGEHGTVVQLSHLTKRIMPKAMSALRDNLTSIYRRDLLNNKIEIVVEGYKLSFTPVRPLIENIDGERTVWKKDFEDYVLHENKSYKIKGFIGLREEGSYSEAGFVLFHRGRVVIQHYKPSEIFGSDNSFQSSRLYGEIDLDEFPVSQSKDDFNWQLDGLEDAFISKMKEISKDYIKKARTYRVPKRSYETEDLLDYYVQNYNKPKTEETESSSSDTKYDVNETLSEETINKDDTTVVKKPLIPTHNINLEIFNMNFNFKIDYRTDIKNTNADIVSVKEEKDYTCLEFNLNFPIYKKQDYNIAFIKDLERFFVMMYVCEKQTGKLSHNDGLIVPYEIRLTMSKFMSELAKNEEAYNEFFNN